METPRRAACAVEFDGTDITEDIRPYLLSLTYRDSEDDAADDLSLSLQDREGVWTRGWLEEAVRAAAGARLSISASVTPEGWTAESAAPLKTGRLELDAVSAKGPPGTVVIKATGLGFATSIRQTRRSRAWENCALSAIAAQIAANGGTTCLYEAARDPIYSRVEQDQESDITFLTRLCQAEDMAVKCVDGRLAVYSLAEYEGQPPFLTITPGCGYTDYELETGSADTNYKICRVSWWDSAGGALVQGTAYGEDYDPEEDQDERVLEIWARAESQAQAEELARAFLRRANRYAMTARFTLPGNPAVAAGRTVELKGWGGWDGVYMISQATHSLDDDGYRTEMDLRRVHQRPAQAAAPAAGGGQIYTVARGDNLSKIAKRFYGSSVLWRGIYEANRDVIGSDPNYILPGQQLVIP